MLASLLAESAIIAAIGGVVGCLIALPINGIVANTMNWASFSEIAVNFEDARSLATLTIHHRRPS